MIDYRKKFLVIFSCIALLTVAMISGLIVTEKVVGNRIHSMDFNEILGDLDVRIYNDDLDVVTASTKLEDIDVIYEDYYTECREKETTSKRYYGTTLEKVEEEQKNYQEKNGLVYDLKSEEKNKVVYYREIKENCPNHFLVIQEDKRIVVYQIKGENNKVVYMNIDDVNIDNLRDELKMKIKVGNYLNSREQLNNFVEDLET